LGGKIRETPEGKASLVGDEMIMVSKKIRRGEIGRQQKRSGAWVQNGEGRGAYKKKKKKGTGREQIGGGDEPGLKTEGTRLDNCQIKGKPIEEGGRVMFQGYKIKRT